MGRPAQAVRALAADPPPGTAVALLDRDGEIEHSSLDAERWLGEHFGAPEHPGLCRLRESSLPLFVAVVDDTTGNP